MNWHKRLEQRFVERIPRVLEPGILYISMSYATAAHSCACGCGEEVMTPFTPTDWKMTFDGETVSLRPSIGNWQLACRSHYVIDRGVVVPAGAWTEKQIAAERKRDRAAKERFYGTPQGSASSVSPEPPLREAAVTPLQHDSGVSNARRSGSTQGFWKALMKVLRI